MRIKLIKSLCWAFKMTKYLTDAHGKPVYKLITDIKLNCKLSPKEIIEFHKRIN